MNALLIANNVTSGLLILVCWWLSHQNAVGREPFGRLIATGYGLLAMATLGNILFRSVEQWVVSLPSSLLASKVVLLATLSLVALRLDILNRQRG